MVELPFRARGEVAWLQTYGKRSRNPYEVRVGSCRYAYYPIPPIGDFVATYGLELEGRAFRSESSIPIPLLRLRGIG